VRNSSSYALFIALPTLVKTDTTWERQMESSRREFLRAVIGGLSVTGWQQKHHTAGHVSRSTVDQGCISELPRFVDRMPIPAVAQPKARFRWATYYEMAMTQITQQLHRDLPPTNLWAYGGVYPGPTFEALRSERVAVNWINSLPSQHLFAVDPTIHGADASVPAVRAVVHLHGANVPPESDGYPEDWITPGQNAIYLYPDKQRSQTLWYHDHAVGITRLNIYAGLAGFYIVRDPEDEKLGLPSGPYEIPILIQDRAFREDGSLCYPTVGIRADIHPNWVPEWFANIAVVNGKVWPYLDVEPRRYRFRFLNACNARFLNLRLSNGQSMTQIGGDGGLLAAPININNFVIAPAERVEAVIDFSGQEGQEITLTNDAPAPFLSGGEVGLTEIMLFRVGRQTVSDRSKIPSVLNVIEGIDERSASKTRDLEFVEIEDDTPEENPLMLLLNNAKWADPVTETPGLGSTEIWRFINTTDDNHPIHLHTVAFQILDRQPFDVDIYNADRVLKFTGPAVKPDPGESAWKDVVRCPAGEVTRIIARFGDFAGRYVWHCHILEHEDNQMMRPFDVVGTRPIGRRHPTEEHAHRGPR
jgi:spore coat protein A, manganese oxidase